MHTATRWLAFLFLALAVAAAGLPMEATMMPEKPSCCLLMNQDGCDEQPVKSSEQQQCCAGCVICLALPAETTPFVYASTGDEAFSTFNIRAHPRAHRPEVPPPRQARA